jgi:hypothetical protein
VVIDGQNEAEVMATGAEHAKTALPIGFALIDGVVAVGPFECMPTKIASSRFFHVAEREGHVPWATFAGPRQVRPEPADEATGARAGGTRLADPGAWLKVRVAIRAMLTTPWSPEARARETRTWN